MMTVSEPIIVVLKSLRRDEEDINAIIHTDAQE
jgi:hypothetical protein